MTSRHCCSASSISMPTRTLGSACFTVSTATSFRMPTGETGGRGMELWAILVLGIIKQGLGCDFDRLHDLANSHIKLRQFLGHSDAFNDICYRHQTLVDTVSLLTPELLAEVNALVVERGHALEKRKPQAPLRGRCDSFVAETNVHYPTDVNLLWDAIRCLVRDTARAAKQFGVPGWRQWKHHSRLVQAQFHRVRRTRSACLKDVEAYLLRCSRLADRAEACLPDLVANGASEYGIIPILEWLAHARRQIDQVERRLLKGETIPHGEKLFSLFEKHTRWISKGKAGRPVELGVPVCVLEDEHGFVLHHEVMWAGSDVEYAVPMVEAAQARYPNLRAVSFDRGFHSPENRARLDDILECNALPKKGYLRGAEREREQATEFAAMRRKHPAVESAINNLEHRCLDRVRAHGASGFDRVVALSVVALNIHRIGLLLRRRKKRKRLKAA